MNMTPYQKRLLKEIKEALEATQRMMDREGDNDTEFMSRLPNIRNQCMQAGIWASELYGSMSQARDGK